MVDEKPDDNPLGQMGKKPESAHRIRIDTSGPEQKSEKENTTADEPADPKMPQRGEPKSRLGVPPVSPQPEKSAEFIEGYREGYADKENGKAKRF